MSRSLPEAPQRGIARSVTGVPGRADLLCGLHGVRGTLASSLLARKRPRLTPITDSIVAAVVATPGRTWPTLQDRTWGCAVLPERNGVATPEVENVSLLRAFDVAIWMRQGATQKRSP